MKKVLAIIQLDIGDTTQKILVHEGESIQQIAVNFCKEFDLNDECVEFLCETINKQIKSHKNLQKQNISQSSSKQMINYLNEQDQIQEVSEENDTTIREHSAQSSLHQQDSLFQKYQPQNNYNNYDQEQNLQQFQQQFSQTKRANVSSLKQDNTKNNSLKDQFDHYKQSKNNQLPQWQKNQQNSNENNQQIRNNQENQNIPELENKQQTKVFKHLFERQQNQNAHENSDKQQIQQFINFQGVLQSKINSKSQEQKEKLIQFQQNEVYKEDSYESCSPMKQNIENEYQKKQFLQNLIQNNSTEQNLKNYHNSSKDSQENDFIHQKEYDQNLEKLKLQNDEAMAKYEFWQNAINMKVQHDMNKRNKQGPVTFLDKQQYYKQISQENSPNQSFVKANQTKNMQKSPKSYSNNSKIQSPSPQNNKKQMNQNYKQSPKNDRPKTPQKIIEQAIHASDRLYQDGKKKLINKKKTDEAFREYHKKEYSFKPEINAQSLQIVQKLNSQKNLFSNYQIHDKLYFSNQLKEIETEIWRTEQFQKQYPFRPESNSPFRQSQSQEEQQEQIKRMFDEKKQNDLKIEQKRIAMQQPIDKNTGQAYFHPKINKDKYYQKVKQRDDLEELIYKKVSKSPQKSTNNSFRNLSPQNTSYSSQNQNIRKTPKDSQSKYTQQTHSSNQNNSSLKSKSPIKRNLSPQKEDIFIRQIFNDLDHDKDGFISEDQIDLGSININILNIIQDILFEIDESQKVFDLQMFNQLFKQEKFKGVVKQLNKFKFNQINLIGSYQKKAHHKNQFSFGEPGDFSSNRHQLLKCKNPPEILYYNEINSKQIKNSPNQNIQMQIDKNFTPHYFQRLKQKQ